MFLLAALILAMVIVAFFIFIAFFATLIAFTEGKWQAGIILGALTYVSVVLELWLGGWG